MADEVGGRGDSASAGDSDEQVKRPVPLGLDAPHEDERFDLEVWRARVTDRLLIAVAAMGAVVLASSVVQAVNEPGWWAQTAPFVVAYFIVLALALLRGRLDYRIRAWGLLLVGYSAAVLYLAILGLLGNGVVFLLALPAMGLIILGVRSGVMMALLSAGLYLLFMAAAATGVMAEWLIIRDNTLAVSQWLSQGLSFGLILVALVVMLAMLNLAQEQALRQTRQAAAELAVAHGELAASSADMDRYAQLLETAAGISHEISGVLARDELLLRAVDLMASRLDLRSVAVYLVDPASGALVAGPAAGESGARAGGPRVLGGGESQVPPVVTSLARTMYRPEGTRHRVGDSGEVALPLQVGGRLLGLLYVAAPRDRLLTDREVQSLHVMADQLAVALDNARLFGEAQMRLDELNALQRQYTMEAWARFVGDRVRPEGTRVRPEYLWQPAGKPGDAVWQEMLDRVRLSMPEEGVPRSQAELGHPRPGDSAGGRGDSASGSAEDPTSGAALVTGPVTGYDEETHQHLVAVPVRLREALIGVLAFHRPRDAGPWQREEISAIEAVGERLAFAAENLRLLEQAQQHAAREGLVDQITRQMQASLDPETILKVTVREVGRALGASRALVEIRPEGYSGREYSPSGSDGGMVEG